MMARRPHIDGTAEPGEWKWIRPTSVRWHHRNFNEKAVRYYMAHPDGRWDGQSGDPYVASDGVGYNGAHRAEAARRKGRKLYAYVAYPRRRGQQKQPAKRKAWWEW